MYAHCLHTLTTEKIRQIKDISLNSQLFEMFLQLPEFSIFSKSPGYSVPHRIHPYNSF